MDLEINNIVEKLPKKLPPIFFYIIVNYQNNIRSTLNTKKFQQILDYMKERYYKNTNDLWAYGSEILIRLDHGKYLISYIQHGKYYKLEHVEIRNCNEVDFIKYYPKDFG